MNGQNYTSEYKLVRGPGTVPQDLLLLFPE